MEEETKIGVVIGVILAILAGLGYFFLQAGFDFIGGNILVAVFGMGIFFVATGPKLPVMIVGLLEDAKEDD